jgi:hypothetical protein
MGRTCTSFGFSSSSGALVIQTLLLHHLPRSLAKLCSLSESESIFSSIQQTSGCSEVCTSRNYMIIHKVKPNFVHIIIVS